ncbi:hypothetical protein GBF35_25670 [Nonomuraea phyllanthi]|uniref:hypothetical protein n=1 Tax=Nonomuraea phyllanthi TaxID=2219224 RepID=UPI001293F026|nr:hypothetical protein [Nonomuraea phyllanthi]QFY09589.1 hypothetical protein GBF35_25670 [Nonomuraea phyllanthi]
MKNPGRLPPKEQRIAAEKALLEAAREYYKAIEEPTRKFNEALAAAAGPPEGVPASDKKSLVTRRRMVEITKEADPEGEGLKLYTILKIVAALTGDTPDE